MQGGLALLLYFGMRSRDAQPLLLAPSAVLLTPRQATLLLAQVSQASVVALRIGDLLPRRKRRQISQSQVHAHRTLPDWQQGSLDLRAESHVVAPRGIARERHQIRSFDFWQRFGKLEHPKFREKHQPARPGNSHILKPKASGGALPFEPWLTSSAREEAAKCLILITQALGETGRGQLCKPFVPRGPLP